MCKALNEGGQRCAAHTKDRLERKARAMREAAARTASLGKEGLAGFHKAREEWEEAAVEYASTPSGVTALKGRLAEAETAGDVQTVAMLTNIVQRGVSMREANEQIRAALTLGMFTETLPDEDLGDALAADENNNALADADQKAWLALVDTISGKAEDSRLNTVAVSAANGSGHNPIATYPAELNAADATIAAATSSDHQLANAVSTLSRALTIHPAFQPEPSPYDDDGGYGHSDWAMQRACSGHEPVLNAQLRRVLNHPNAGPRAFANARKHLPPNESLLHPNCPDTTLMVLNARVAEHLDADTWQTLRTRASTSLPTAVFIAQHDPNEASADDARMHLSGTQWDTVPTDQLAYLRRNLTGVFGTEQAPAVEQSLVEWVRYFGDDAAKQQVLTSDERTPAAATPEPVSLTRRSPRLLRTGR